jgi:hypothetical protein
MSDITRPVSQQPTHVLTRGGNPHAHSSTPVEKLYGAVEPFVGKQPRQPFGAVSANNYRKACVPPRQNTFVETCVVATGAFLLGTIIGRKLK